MESSSHVIGHPTEHVISPLESAIIEGEQNPGMLQPRISLPPSQYIVPSSHVGGHEVVHVGDP